MEDAPLHLDICMAPQNGLAYWITASDNVKLRVAHWKAPNPSKGTVFFFPGRGDYIELYGHTIADLVDASMSTLVIDWRGHGLSDRIARDQKIGHLDSFADYQKDVAAMIAAAEQLELPKPWFVVAHSMGGCIALRSLIAKQTFDAAVLSAPMWSIEITAIERAAAWPVTWFLKTIGKGAIYAPGSTAKSYVFKHAFADNNLTHSEAMYEHWIAQGTKIPDLHTGGPSMGWLYAALKETRDLSKLPSPNIPCLTFCGDKEEVVQLPAIETRMKAWTAGQLEMVPNGRHELFLEADPARSQVIMRTIEFLRSV